MSTPSTRELFLRRVAFERQKDGSEFHDLVINQSISHTNRTDPAWVYAFKDAEFGAAIEAKRLTAVHAAVADLVEAAENVRCSRYPERSHIPELEQALVRLREVCGDE